MRYRGGDEGEGEEEAEKAVHGCPDIVVRMIFLDTLPGWFESLSLSFRFQSVPIELFTY